MWFLADIQFHDALRVPGPRADGTNLARVERGGVATDPCHRAIRFDSHATDGVGDNAKEEPDGGVGEVLNRPGVRGDFWPWKTKEEVHAERSDRWEADDASVFA